MPVHGAYFENMRVREHEFSAIPHVYDEKVYHVEFGLLFYCLLASSSTSVIGIALL